LIWSDELAVAHELPLLTFFVHDVQFVVHEQFEPVH
jgi:hypothetical protein